MYFSKLDQLPYFKVFEFLKWFTITMNQYHGLMRQSTSHAGCNFPTLFCFRNTPIGLSVIISNEIIYYLQAETRLYTRVHFRSFQEFNCVVIQKQITKHANQTCENNEKNDFSLR